MRQLLTMWKRQRNKPMNNKNYQQLHAESKNDAALLGIVLPELTPGFLAINHSTLTIEQTCAAIDDFAPDQGWVMYRDEIVMSSKSPTRTDLIEAEYSQKDKTLTVRLIGPNRYSVCLMEPQEIQTPTMVYKTQSMLTQKRLTDDQCIEYRLWYKQQTDGSNAGRWEATTQQFIGFTASQEN